MTEVAARYESSTSFDLPMFLETGLYFVTFFPNRFKENITNRKDLLAYLVISSGNCLLVTSALEMILTFFWTTESSSSLSDSQEELHDWHGEEDTFLLFPLLL